MKSFKQFLQEQKEYKTINLMLQDYVSGAIEDFDNKGSFIDLFDPNGKGLPKALRTFDLTIMNGNEPFTGKGIVIKDNMVFKLSDGKTLNVGLKKSDDGTEDYIITNASVK